MTDEKLLKISSLLLLSAEKCLLKKAILSKPNDKGIQKTVLTRRVISKKDALQAETFHKDNKATHKNLFLDELTPELLSALLCEFKQINLITTVGECELRTSSSGKIALLGDKKLDLALNTASISVSAESLSNDREKKRILDGSEPFLKLLGVADENGRVFDKKQSKFKQINRFLEIIRDCEDKLPSDSIRICDLCCGKSYLSFAVYYFLSFIKSREVELLGIDLKRDVIEWCNNTKNALGFSGMTFVAGDIADTPVGVCPDMVISLHACDVATDIVLDKAVKLSAPVILSTPCCHRYMNGKVTAKELRFVTKYPHLQNKLCEALTDALRAARLEASGYAVSVLELTDPENTPKNTLIRAIKRGDTQNSEKKEEYNAILKFIVGDGYKTYLNEICK